MNQKRNETFDYSPSAKKEVLPSNEEPWRIMLALTSQEDEKLFADQLNEQGLEFELEEWRTDSNDSDKLESTDLAVLDENNLPKARDRLRRIKRSQEPRLVPTLALVSGDGKARSLGGFNTLVDEIVVKPIKKVELRARLQSLLRTRELSLEMEKKHRSITRNAHELISIIDDQGQFDYANRAHKELLGRNPKTLEGKSLFELIHHEDINKIRGILRGPEGEHGQGQPEEPEAEMAEPLRVEAREGGYRWVEPVVAPLEKMDGSWRFLITARDVTERRAAAEERKKQKGKAETYLKMAGTMIVVLEEDGTVKEINKRGTQVLGYSREEVIGQNWLHNFYPKRVREEILGNYRNSLLEGETVVHQNPILTKKGEERTVSWRCVPTTDAEGELEEILVSGRDITEQKRAAERLRQERDRAQRYLNMAGTIIVFIDDQGIVTEVNRRGCEVLGYEKEEILGENWFEKFLPQDIRAEIMNEVHNPLLEAKEEKQTYRNPVLTKDGEKKIISWKNTTVRDDEGEVTSILSSGRDITERIRSQERINYLNDLLRSINEINELIAKEDNFRDIIQGAQEILCGRKSYVQVELFVFGGDSENPIYVGGEGFPQIRLSSDGTGEGPRCAKQALSENEPVVVNYPASLCRDCDFHEERHPPEHQTVAIPLSGEERREGVMIIRFDSGQIVQEKELDLLEGVAGDLAHAREKLRAENELEETTIGTLKALSRTVEAKDKYTGDHVDRVQKYALKLGEELGMSTKELEQLQYASELHDVGKVRIPEDILTKDGELTEEEWEEIEKHPEIGEEIVGAVPRLESAATIVGQHQERYDGTGYPKGLQGEDITLGARIIAVVDAWDAMRTDRPYRNALPREVAIEELKENSGTQFDPEVVAVFLEIVKGRDSELES